MIRLSVVVVAPLVVVVILVSGGFTNDENRLDLRVRKLSSSEPPSVRPSVRPSVGTSVTPSSDPSVTMSADPSIVASETPTFAPAQRPTKQPTTATPSPTPKTPPHIVMIVVDDMGFGDLGIKGSGIYTPTMDNLLTTGTHLTNYYTLEACTQTRIAIMTGKYPYRSGIFRCVAGNSGWGMDTGDKTIANALRERGYQAHAIGKWHVGHASSDYLPTFRGFQSFYGIWKNQFYTNHSDQQGISDLRWDKEEFCGWNCFQTPDARGVYSTTLFTNQAIKRIQTFQPQNGSLFLYLAFQGVHSPYEVPSLYSDLYQSKSGWSAIKKTYAGMLTAVDTGISRVLGALQNASLWNNTLIVVTTDNGAPVGSTRGSTNYPLRGHKLQAFEGGIRADGIIAGPARAKLGIKAGKNSNIMHVIDWLPTLAGLADVSAGKPEAGWSNILDGISQVRSLRGRQASRNEVFLGYEYLENATMNPRSVAAYRIGDVKFLRYLNGGNLLYNLTSDLNETVNLIQKKQYSILIATMNQKISAFEAQFLANPPLFSPCARFSYGKTQWGQQCYIPWCDNYTRSSL